MMARENMKLRGFIQKLEMELVKQVRVQEEFEVKHRELTDKHTVQIVAMREVSSKLNTSEKELKEAILERDNLRT